MAHRFPKWSILSGVLFAVFLSSAWGAKPSFSFDYYVLALSWSPAYCSSPEASPTSAQCSHRPAYGFVVHGLWPQKERGGDLSYCGKATPLPRYVVERFFPAMPDERLVRYQWKKHGTCSGLEAEDYAAVIRRAFASLELSLFRANRTMRAPDVKRVFLRVNPRFSEDSVRFVCQKGNFREIRLCLEKDGITPRACPRSLRESCP